MSKPLNPQAAEFVPSSYKSDVSWGNMTTEDCSEDHITPEELEELEAAEQWVELQVDIEMLEEDHLVAVALRYAPEAKINEIRKRFAVKPGKARGHKGIRARGVASAW